MHGWMVYVVEGASALMEYVLGQCSEWITLCTIQHILNHKQTYVSLQIFKVSAKAAIDILLKNSIKQAAYRSAQNVSQ
jgi:hypothetical protein